MENYNQFKQDLKFLISKHEGYNTKLYKCTAGKLTIGIGYNIEERGLPDEVIRMLFEADLERVQKEAILKHSQFNHLHLNAQLVICDMLFQLGFKKYDQLDQLDLTAYLWLLRMAGPDLTVKCTAHSLLKMMGKENDPKAYRWLEGFLERITTSSFCCGIDRKRCRKRSSAARSKPLAPRHRLGRDLPHA
jgi:lysozyme